jgi:hypothetical protein
MTWRRRVCSAELLPFMDDAIFRAPPQLCKVYWPSSSSSPLVVTNADGSVTVTCPSPSPSPSPLRFNFNLHA